MLHLKPSSATILRNVPSAPDSAFLVASACMRVLITSSGCTHALMAAPESDPAQIELQLRLSMQCSPRLMFRNVGVCT